MWRYEIASVKMAVQCATHHSAQRCAHVDQGVQVGVLWTHDFGMSETSDESPVAEYVAPAPAVACDEPAPVIEYMSSAAVIEYFAPAPAVTLSVPSQQLHLAFNADVNFDSTCLVHPRFSFAAVEAISPLVVSLLPPFAKFDALVYS